MPLVTIGIPAYNAEKFIASAIKSVINQSFQDWELIITDDGSTDRTLDIIHSFQDPRIKLFSDGINRGISFRLNQEIDLARGKYFMRMDADDLMLPDRIERQVNYLDTHPDVDMIGGGAIIIDDENQIIGQRRTNRPMQIDQKKWLEGNGFIHPTVIGKIDFFKKLKYSIEFSGVEDVHLWMRASKENKLVKLPDYVMFYRDPLKFKLKTFLLRQRQIRRLYRSRDMREILSRRPICRLLIKSYLKGFTASLLSFLHLDQIMISQRNKLFPDSSEYAELLKDLTKG